MATKEEKNYLNALCRGEREGISAIYRDYARQVQSWVVKNNGDPADAKDLFQESLVAIFDRYCQSDFKLTASFGALLFSICKKQWYSRLRQKKREESVRNIAAEQYIEESVEEDLLILAEETLADKKREDCLQQTFSLLSEQCRQLLSLLAKGRSGTDIAKQLGMPNANAVYQAKHRCAGRWRRLFEKEFNG